MRDKDTSRPQCSSEQPSNSSTSSISSGTNIGNHDNPSLLFPSSIQLTYQRYLRTIDIAHDHVGFYMIWGCLAWLPTTYTLHVQYMARNDFSLDDTSAIALFLVGTAGYVLFRISNNQKYHVRNTQGQCSVWGKSATFITATYRTADGADRQSILLTCGTFQAIFPSSSELNTPC